ncbi:hypothetical protein KY289_015300 [Solanum tuberosum]|nr:hypothetical protein KY289_015300 [Solanum tuberosum]
MRGKRRAMREGHARRRLSDVGKRRAMRPGHARRRLSDGRKRRALRPGHARRRRSDARKRRAMRVGHARRRLTVVGKRRAMRAGHARRPRNRCVQAKGDAGRQRPTSTDRCVHPRPMQPGHVRRDLDQGRAVHGRCGEATADVG